LKFSFANKSFKVDGGFLPKLYFLFGHFLYLPANFITIKAELAGEN